MARYIDADKVMEEINRIGGHNLCGWSTIGVKALIDRQQTADVVEVVRCCDCKHRIENPDINNTCYLTCNKKWGLQGIVDPTDFCSYGENALKERENR